MRCRGALPRLALGGRACSGVNADLGGCESPSYVAVAATSLVPGTPRATRGAAGHSGSPSREFGSDLPFRWGLFRGERPQAEQRSPALCAAEQPAACGVRQQPGLLCAWGVTAGEPPLASLAAQTA